MNKVILKRLVACALVFVLVFAMAGCGKKADTSAEKIPVSGVNEFPITKEKSELTIFIAKPSMIADIEKSQK